MATITKEMLLEYVDQYNFHPRDYQKTNNWMDDYATSAEWVDMRKLTKDQQDANELENTDVQGYTKFEDVTDEQI